MPLSLSFKDKCIFTILFLIPLLLPLNNNRAATEAKSNLEVILLRPNTQNVIDVQQITATFNKTMVPLGDYEKLAADFKISVIPNVDCQWRWLNGSTIACQLNKALPSSNTYKITVPAGLRALDGSVLKKAKSESFSTLHWDVVSKEIEWKAPDSPRIYLGFNQAMDLSSVQKNVVSNCGNVSVSKLKGQSAEDLGMDLERSLLFTFEQPIGIAKSCQLTIKGTALSASGPVPSKMFSFAFSTFSEFKISKVTCADKVTGTSIGTQQIEITGCDPDSGIDIELNTPTTGKYLAGNVQSSPQFGWSPGGEGSPEYYSQHADEEHNEIYLKGLMQGAGQHKINLQGLKDRFGRSLMGATEVLIKTSDFTPILQLPDGYGVLEKNGPHQLAMSGVNVKEVDLDYYQSKNPQDVKMWESFRSCTSNDPKKSNDFIFLDKLKLMILQTEGEKNLPFTSAIDFSKIAPEFKYGMFVGKIESARDLTGKPFSAHRVCSNFFTVVTDLGLTAKVGFYSSGIWVHSIKTGEPLRGVKAGLYTNEGPIFEGHTDGDGFLELPGAQKWDPERNKFRNWNSGQNLYVLAETKSDFSVLPFEEGQRGLDYYEFSQVGNSMWFGPLKQSTNHIIHAITDRPLYMPGQKVNVKIFARHWEPRTYGMRPAKELTVEVRDALDQSIFTKKLTLSEFGTADFSFDLDASGPTGGYRIVARADSFETTATYFDVQVFTLPVFKVQVQAKKPSLEVGEAATFETSAHYHFGGGVPNAKGEYTAHFTPGYWRPKTPKWEAFTFENYLDLNITGYEKPRATEIKQLAAGELKTDKNGNVSTNILLPNDQVKSYGHLEYGVSFKDDRGKSIASYESTEIFYSKFLIGIKTPKWTYEAKKEILPEVIILDHNEKPVPGVSVELKLIHRSYKTVRRHGEGSYFYYDSKSKDKQIASCTFKSSSTPNGCGLKTVAAGDHYIVALAKDSRGRTTQSALQQYITGSEYVGWYRENHDRIDLIPEKKTCKMGETVKLLVKNPYQEVDALITVERFGILKQFRQKLTRGAEIISIPIDSKDYAPGFYVGVQLIKGRTSEKLEGGVDLGKPSFKMGMTKINVIDPDTLLKVSAQANKEQYEPGDQSQVSLKVSTPGGNEVSELSVAVVDEKILQLAGNYEERYNLHDKFYDLVSGDVITSQMLSFLIGRRHFGKKGAPAGGDGDSKNSIRKNNLPLAYWNPTVITDKSGQAEVRFKLPDNLTTWRVLVVAVDKKHRFGFGSSTFRTSKKIMIEPGLPSFLTEGDKLKSRFTIFNRTGRAANINAQIKVQGVELAEGDRKDAPIENDGKTNFDWLVKTPFGQSQAIFEVQAATKLGQDGIKETLPIYPYASYETFANYGSTTDAKIIEQLQIPKGIRTELGGLDVLLSPTLISHLDDSFRYLFNYPYTCWEQTMVRAIALGQYARLKQYLTIPELTKNPIAWSTELMATMANYQYENGGMSYWKPDARTIDPYLSVFSALGLQWLKESKVSAPIKSRQNLFKYVRRLVQGTEAFPKGYGAKAKATVLAMAAHVLVQEGDNMTSQINKLYQERKNLTLFGKSFLWMAASKQKETKALLNVLKNEIYSASDMTSGSIQFKEASDDGFVQILHSTTRTNCSLLSAMMVEDPKGKFVEPLVRWIIAGRKSNRWNNTQENLYCQNALAQYAAYYEKDVPNFSVSGTAMNQKVSEVNFKDFKEKPRSQTISFAADVVGKKSSLVLEKKGPGRLYYTARMNIAYKDVRTSPVNSGMQVSRTYFVKDSNGTWLKQGSLIKLKRGELVKIVLKVNIPAVRNHVVLDDKLPAGLEPLNTALASTSKEDAKAEKNNSSGNYFWSEDDNWYGFYSSGGFYHREMRLHSVQYFANYLSAGEFELAYMAQAIATGEFNSNPALVAQMYEPEVYGKSSPAQFIIQE